jgi:hypothetical protein
MGTVEGSGVTRNDKASGKNCVMGPTTSIFFILRADFQQLSRSWFNFFNYCLNTFHKAF